MKTILFRKIFVLGYVMVLTVLLATAAVAKRPAPKADLALSMTRSPSSVQTGETVTHSISVSNLGPSVASRVKVIDTYESDPPGWAWGASATIDRGSCTVDSQITCTIESLGSGETIGMVVKISSQNAGTLINTASVSGDQIDPSASNNSASTSTEIYECSLSSQDRPGCPSVSMSDLTDPVNAGEIIVYDIQADSHYDYSDAYSSLVMNLPEGTELINARDPDGYLWGCSYSTYAGRVITCDYSRTRPNAKIALRVLKPGALTSTVYLYVGRSVASATAITQVGAARAPGADTPVPLNDVVGKWTHPIPNCISLGRCWPRLFEVVDFVLENTVRPLLPPN